MEEGNNNNNKLSEDSKRKMMTGFLSFSNVQFNGFARSRYTNPSSTTSGSGTLFKGIGGDNHLQGPPPHGHHHDDDDDHEVEKEEEEGEEKEKEGNGFSLQVTTQTKSLNKVSSNPGGNATHDFMLLSGGDHQQTLPNEDTKCSCHCHRRFRNCQEKLVQPDDNNPSAVDALAIAVTSDGGGGGGSGGGSDSALSDHDLSSPRYSPTLSSSPPKKRFRTKFTKKQKDSMLQFAKKIGWRIRKENEEQVDKFCLRVGLKRQVFKVWLQNHRDK